MTNPPGFLLDTNVVSQRIKLQPDERVATWAATIPLTSMFLSVMSLQEFRFGIETMPAGRKRERLETWISVDLRQTFADRLLPVNEQVAELAGSLVAAGKRSGAEPEIADALIAATAHVHNLQVATLNRKHFKRLGVPLVDFSH